MQLTKRYHIIYGIKITAFFCAFLLNISIQAQQDFSRVKSKYEYSTPKTQHLAELVKSKNYEEGLSYIDESMESILNQYDFEQVIYLLERKSYILRRLERFDEAEVVISEVISLAREHLGNNHILLAKAYLMRGQIEHRIGDFYTATFDFDTSQVIYQKSPQYDSAIYESIIDYKFYAYNYAERNVDTLTKYLDLRYKNALSNRASEPHDLIYLMNDFPRLYREKGDFDQALRYSISEVIFAQENYNDILPTDHIAAFSNLVQTLFAMKKYELALTISDDALTLYAKEKRFKDILSINNILSLRPLILTNMGQNEKAVEAYLGLIDDFSQYRAGSEFKFLIQQQINVAKCLLELGEKDKARNYLTKALANIKSVNQLPDKQAESLFATLGSYYKWNDDPLNSFLSYDSSIRNGIPEYYLDSALHFPNVKDQKISFAGLVGLKNKAVSLNDLFEKELADSLALIIASKDYVLNTHRILVERRKELMRTEGKLFLSENFKDLYETGLKAAYLLTQNGKYEEGISAAIEIFQMSKSLLFLEQAGEFDQINQSNIPTYLKERYYSLSQESAELTKLFDKNFSPSNLVSTPVKNLNNAILENNKLILQIKDSINQLINTKDENAISTYHEVHKSTIPKNEVVIEFFVGEKVIYVLGRSQNKDIFESIVLDAKLETAIESIISEVSNRPSFSDYSATFSNFYENSRSVYETLLSPVLNQLEYKPKSITIIPDDFLSRLPFEVLITQEGLISKSFKDLPYLIKSYNVNYLLSSSPFQQTHERIAEKNILGIGYSTTEMSNSSSSISLPGTDREIKQIQSKFDGSYYLGKEGTKKLFLEEASKFDILHIAIHGEMDENEKYEARLIFNGTDSILNTQDLYLANLKARLAILSACESGKGKLNKGEGTFSIARGFALVGVPSVIMSLWNLNDKVSSELMISLHDYIAQGLSTTEALNKSKLSYLEKSDNYTAHPYYWSSFVSLGESIVLKPKSNNYGMLLLGSIVALLLLTLIYSLLSKKRRKAI
ncbi:MAG: hypothetical protein COW40_08715 [Cytophagales bacterium CG17_big_fil_post_rev_8_21_14_2_50_40_13]|nr:MAG: hypothetical protein COW40_08715 [Cytophagales bacterium CG17_big_fil_post_rev_8_21_14_2_50_40_13]